MAPKKNFLSQLIENDNRRSERRAVKLECVAYYLKKGLRGYTSQKGTMINLSEGGCMITCPAPAAVDQHLYLVITGIPAKFTCAVVNRSEANLNLRFNADLPTGFVQQLTASRF